MRLRKGSTDRAEETRAVPAVGFAMGLERLVAVLEEVNPTAGDSAADVYLVLAGEAAQAEGLILAETLRDALPQMEIVCNCGGGSMKAQFKRADRSGAAVALVLGDDELKADQVVMKPLRSGADQQLVARAEIVGALKGLLNFESAAECITEN